MFLFPTRVPIEITVCLISDMAELESPLGNFLSFPTPKSLLWTCLWMFVWRFSFSYQPQVITLHIQWNGSMSLLKLYRRLLLSSMINKKIVLYDFLGIVHPGHRRTRHWGTKTEMVVIGPKDANYWLLCTNITWSRIQCSRSWNNCNIWSPNGRVCPSQSYFNFKQSK